MTDIPVPMPIPPAAVNADQLKALISAARASIAAAAAQAQAATAQLAANNTAGVGAALASVILSIQSADMPLEALAADLP